MAKTVSDTYPITEFNGIAVDTSLPCASGYYTVCSSREVKYIVMHYTGNKSDTARANASYYHSGNTREASAHYFVDDDSCYQSVSPNNRAWHCGASSYRHAECRNANSIGIEMCTSGSYIVSDETITNAVYLCAALCEYVGIGADEVDTYVVRHYDVTGKSCPAQWASDSSAEFADFKARVAEVIRSASAAVVEEYKDINAIVWELWHKGILEDKDLWVRKCKADENIYWLCRKLCQYVRTKSPGEYADKPLTDYDQILWDLEHRGIISDKVLWKQYMTDDMDVYWLMYKGLHWCRTY